MLEVICALPITTVWRAKLHRHEEPIRQCRCIARGRVSSDRPHDKAGVSCMYMNACVNVRPGHAHTRQLHVLNDDFRRHPARRR
jgi:hypothetical protein